MVPLLRITVGMLLMLAASAAQSVQLAYEPVGLGWSDEEVEHASAVQMDALAERAEAAHQMGCSAHCARLARVFSRLVDGAKLQTTRSATLGWSLLVVRLPDVQAMAMPNGRLAISEAFVEQHLQTDETLAFVLAHEMIHSILEHERQALTFAQLMLPRQIVRSVRDMYVEIDFNLSLLMAMEPVMHKANMKPTNSACCWPVPRGSTPTARSLLLKPNATPIPAVSPSWQRTRPPASDCRRLSHCCRWHGGKGPPA